MRFPAVPHAHTPSPQYASHQPDLSSPSFSTRSPGIRQLWLLPVLHQHICRATVRPTGPGTDLGRPRGGGRCRQPLLQGLSLPPVAAQGPCLAHGGTDIGVIGQECLARSWARPGSTECGLWAWVRPVPSLSPSPTPTVALYLFGSCFGDWVGLDCGSKDVCRASPSPLYTPPPSPQSAPNPSLGPEQPLTPGQKSLWLSP